MSDHIFSRVLLVEDDKSHALLIKRALKRYTATVMHYEKVADAVAALATASPDLILTDLNLPDTTGLAHITRLIEAGQDTPVVVLTSSTSLKEAVEAMRLGANDYLVKNFDTDFVEVLGLALSRLYASIELAREKARLRREMEVLRIAIENGHDGMAIVGGNGEVRYCNASFRTFVERCGGKAGKIGEFFSPAVERYQSLTENCERNLSTLSRGAIWKTEVTFVEHKDQAFELSLSMTAPGEHLADPAGKDESVIWVHDISEQKRREKFQREILSTTTHDLKGPLGAITISTELLTEYLQTQDRARELVLRISSCAHSALNLIEEFLSARRIQEGNLILKPASHQPEGIVNEVIEEYRTIAASKQINLHSEFQEHLPPVLVDKIGLVRVLGNLLTNAFKFTRKGGSVTVRLSFVREELHLVVEDTGSGMEPSDVQKIFERFSRLDRHTEIAGTGLGLFVVKSIVNAHGGKIDVTSKLGEGTKFDVALPARPPVNERGELISLDFA